MDHPLSTSEMLGKRANAAALVDTLGHTIFPIFSKTRNFSEIRTLSRKPARDVRTRENTLFSNNPVLSVKHSAPGANLTPAPGNKMTASSLLF
jgi:hypothetical protein